jgi:hypothetical protein
MFGCPSCVTEDGQVAQDAKVRLFASVNKENLAFDMARGEGEHLESLAALLHVPAEQHQSFFSHAQEEYRILGAPGEAAVERIVASLQSRAY